MIVKFLWANGQLDYTTALALDHLNLVQRMIDKGKLPRGQFPENYVGGTYNSDSGEMRIIWSGGTHPNETELRFLLEQDMEHYDTERYQYRRHAADVEDTEPEFNFGFLADPHPHLYPCAWEDNNKMRTDAKAKLKAHVMNALEGPGGFQHADQWIYFTVYGSGASYNWDEDGDFDIQMWVDIEKYNQHHTDGPLTSDELISMVRRAVQVVNFPSFHELGLDAPINGDEDVKGTMLIQYYPKAGTGAAEENLAQKPYACYDMETDEWLVEPKPITADFYGQHFIIVETKANDIAEQSEALISQLQRNILNWQFWMGLHSKYKNPDYRSEAEKSQINATIEKSGIATLFEGVFGGRQQAYSEEGKGLDDERDACQKLLEVWGVFQKLKHYARISLPWDEQEVPVEPKTSADHQSMASGAFGYIGGRLIFGYTHHQAIMQALINNGWTWEQLMNEPQMWGWWSKIQLSTGVKLNVSFSSDSGTQDDSLREIVGEEFRKEFPNYDITMDSSGYGVGPDEEYGKGLKGKDFSLNYQPGGMYYDMLNKNIFSELPPPPKTSMWKESIAWSDTYWKEQGLPYEGCFGYVAGHLILGSKHHQLIMAKLIDSGWTWEQLFEAEQAWGWFEIDQSNVDFKYNEYTYEYDVTPGSKPGTRMNIRFTSDAGIQNEEAVQGAIRAFVDRYHMPVDVGDDEHGVNLETKEYGAGLRGKQYMRHYEEGGHFRYYLDSIENTPPPPTQAPLKPAIPVTPVFTPGGGAPPPKNSSLKKFADWNEIMDKAQRLRNNGQVQIQVNEPDHVAGTVEGDHGTYNTEIWRDDPQSQAITMWNCDCPWSQYSWGRTRQWKKYEGRPCAHTLALFWQAQATPPADANSPVPAASPPIPGVGGQMTPTQGLISEVPTQMITGPAAPMPQQAPQGPPPPPPDSEITTPTTNKSQLGIPGALSSWREAKFENGDIVRLKYDAIGDDTVTNIQYTVPQSTAGEVIYSDNVETIAIFPLSGGILTPHLVKIDGLTSEFYIDETAQPFIKKKKAALMDAPWSETSRVSTWTEVPTSSFKDVSSWQEISTFQ